jgi:DNA-binding response OmpR family regulator
MRELLARVKALLRRTRLIREEKAQVGFATAAEQMAFANLVIDTARREVTQDGAPLQLKPKEYDLLLFLAQHKGRLLTREFILERVWGWDFIGDSRTVDVHVRWLRQKIEPDPSAPQRIVTVRGGGYRFEG